MIHVNKRKILKETQKNIKYYCMKNNRKNICKLIFILKIKYRKYLMDKSERHFCIKPKKMFMKYDEKQEEK